MIMLKEEEEEGERKIVGETDGGRQITMERKTMEDEGWRKRWKIMKTKQKHEVSLIPNLKNQNYMSTNEVK
jgi:hypothetical protein